MSSLDEKVEKKKGSLNLKKCYRNNIGKTHHNLLSTGYINYKLQYRDTLRNRPHYKKIRIFVSFKEPFLFSTFSFKFLYHTSMKRESFNSFNYVYTLGIFKNIFNCRYIYLPPIFLLGHCLQVEQEAFLVLVYFFF